MDQPISVIDGLKAALDEALPALQALPVGESLDIAFLHFRRLADADGKKRLELAMDGQPPQVWDLRR